MNKNPRYDFFATGFNGVANRLPLDMLNYILDYYKQTKLKFKTPSKPQLHTIDNWTEKLDDEEIIYTRIPTKKDLKAYFCNVALSAVIKSNWFKGIDETGFTEINGPIICKFVPTEQQLDCTWITPIFLRIVKLDKTINPDILPVHIQNQLITKDIVDLIMEYYNTGNYNFGINSDNNYVIINNAIENIVNNTNLYIPGEFTFNDGLIFIVSNDHIWFSFSPMWYTFRLEIPNMIEF